MPTVKKINSTYGEKILFFFLIFLCRFLMDAVYRLSISPAFDYAMMIDRPTENSVFLSWGLLFLFTLFAAPFTSANKNTFVSSIVIILFVIRVIPLTSFIMFSPQPPLYVVYSTIYWCLLLFLLNTKLFEVKDILKLTKNEKVINIIAIILMLSVVVVSGVYTGFRLQLSFEDIYDIREEARGYTAPVFLSYLLSAAGNVIPILVVYYILKKNKWYVIALVLIGILNFGIAGQKSTIFKIFACVAMIYFKKIDLRKAIIPFVIIMLLLAIVLFVQYNNTTISWMMVRRMFYIPNVIDTMYYDYISKHNPLFFDSTATGNLAFNITEVYGMREGGRSNNGMFSDAYQNLGMYGIVVFPILLTMLINLFSKSLKGHNNSIIVFVALVMATSLQGSLLTRCLFTHGFIILLITLLFMPITDDRKQSKTLI